MMQNFGLEDLSHMQSRRNLLKYLVRVEMASDWFMRIYQSILAEQISSKIKICKLGCGLFLSPQSHYYYCLCCCYYWLLLSIVISTELLALCDGCLGWGWVWRAGLVAGL